ncbi:MAG: acyclic terpene utilization AtuA family protein [Pseudomonadota bacterium]
MVLRVGTGAGFSSDRLDPAVELASRGELDYLVFECIGERTLAFGHRDRMANPDRGYNPLLERRLRAVMPHCRRAGTRIVTNMGVANPRAAAEVAVRVARETGWQGCRVATVLGDEVTGLMSPDTELLEGMRIAETGRECLGANAYLGADALMDAMDADVVITGRVADPSLFLAPMRRHYDWAGDDWSRLAKGTVVGHLLECAAQITGGYFADPGFKEVSNLASVGFPYAEIGPDGSAVISKLNGTGGVVDERTVKEQLLYEVHDPAAYLTPDVTADFSTVQLHGDGPDRVAVSAAQGQTRPPKLKVTVAFDGGFLAEAGVSYAGPGAQERARIAADVVSARMRDVHGTNAPVRVDLIGVSSLHATATEYDTDSRDVRVHCAMRGSSQEEADLLLWEVESLLCCGPAGGGGYRGHVTPSVLTYSTFVERSDVPTSVEVSVA